MRGRRVRRSVRGVSPSATRLGGVPVPDLDAWRALPAAQQPTWPDESVLRDAANTLSAVPPIVVPYEVEALRDRLAAGGPGQGVPAPGRRLRGDLRRQHRAAPALDDQGAAADGRRAHLRRERAGGQGRPGGRPVRQAALGRARCDGPALLPRRHGQRHRRRPRRAYAGPRPHGARLRQLRRGDEHAPGLHPGRPGRPARRARLEQGLRPHLPRRAALRGAGQRDRPRPGIHARLRGQRRRPARGRALLQPRGAASSSTSGP